MIVEQRFFSKWSYVHLDCELDNPVKIFLPKDQIELKELRKNQQKGWLFLLKFFNRFFANLSLNAREKRYFSNTFANVEKCTLSLITLKRLLSIEFSKRFRFSLSKFARKNFLLSKSLRFEKRSFCDKTRSFLPEKSSSTEFDGSKNNSGSWTFLCFCIHVSMRSKCHQHRSCNFRLMIGNCVYISNRCSLTLREKIEKTRMLSKNLWNPIGSFTEIFRRESNLLQVKLKEFFEKSKILIVLKTFFTNTALPKCEKHERRLLRKLRKTNLVIS